MNDMNEGAPPKISFQDISPEMRPTSAMTSGVITSTLSEYDVGNSTDIMVVTVAMRNSTLHSTSNASSTMDVSTMNLSTSVPYIPDEFVLPNRIFFAPLISLILLIGIVANILAIVATRHAIRIYRTHRSRKVTIASYLIQCLMMVDLSAVVVFFVRGMFYNLYNDAYFKCDLNSVTNYFFSWAAGFVNAVMCFERCVALTAPFYYHSNATISKAKVGVIVVLLLAFITAMLPIFGIGSYKVLIAGTYYCIGPGDFTLDETGYDYHFGVLFLVTGIGILIFIHTCNIIVITKIMEIRSRSMSLRRHKAKDANDGMSTKSARSTKEETSTFMNGTIETTSSSSMVGNTDAVDGEVGHHSPLRGGRRPRVKKPGKTEINVAKQIIVISIVFTISWLPFYVQRLLKAFDVEQPEWYLLLVIFLLVSNHVIDPFVFVFMKQQSRDALKDLCMKCICCRRCRPPPLSSRNTVNVHANGNQNRGASRNDSGINNSRNDSGIVVVVDSTLNPTEAPTANPAPDDDIHLDIANNRATHSAS